MHEDDLTRGLASATELSIAKLRLGEGEVLLVQSDRGMTSEMIERARQILGRAGLDQERIVFVDGSVSFAVASAMPERCSQCGTPSAGECKRHDCARKAFDVVGGQG